MSELRERIPLSDEVESAFADLIAEITDKLHTGEPVDIEACITRHPEWAERLRELLPALVMMAEVSAAGGETERNDGEPLRGTLGDFRIVREVGRGGMGVVYEAEQISLGRRVALKVLPFAATMDSRQLQRFQNEARAAASLDHPHIVKVHAVGQERGVHYYAMQFIDGQSLAQLIAGQTPVSQQPPQPEDTAPSADTRAVAVASTQTAPRDTAYFRRVAKWGIAAAEALEYAHGLGIVHRDVKPANLMLDDQGRLWLTDFGLARTAAASELTMTGDLLGTLRYMSPEQTVADHGLVDHCTDVYSLGATLYELLTGQPAVKGENRQQILKRITDEEPDRLRRLDNAIPPELETIVLKALEKNPHERYETAQQLADDLLNWLEDRPIQARRPRLVARAQKWSRRHKVVVRAMVVVGLLLLVVGIGNAFWMMQKRTEAETEARAALHDGKRRLQQEKWSEGLSAVQQARGVLRGYWADAGLWREVDQLGKDLQMAQKLEEAGLQATEVKSRHYDYEAGEAAYVAAFEWYGLDVERGAVDELADSIRSRPIHRQLVAALDFWAALRVRKGEDVTRLLAVARAADSDTWRSRLRDACERQDAKAIDELLAAEEITMPASGTVMLLTSYPWANSRERVATLLRRAQQRQPNDFWINQQLASLLHSSQPPNLEEAIRHYMIIVALRPQSPAAHLNLGNALHDQGRLDQAIDEFGEALRLNKDMPEAHNNRGLALQDKGRLEEAIAEFREAIRLKSDEAIHHYNLGGALQHEGRLGEAIDEFREAIRLKKDYASAHLNLALALQKQGQLDSAIDEFREVVRLRKDDAISQNNLGAVLATKGQLDEAIALFRAATRNKPDYAEAHVNLGIALEKNGHLDDAIAVLRAATQIRKDDAVPHFHLANFLQNKGRLDDAIAEFREAIRIKKDYAEAHNNLGVALKVKGRLGDAIAEYREAIRIKVDLAEAHYNLANLLGDMGQTDKAIDEYRQAIRWKKDYADAHSRLGLALADKGDLEEAIDAFRVALRCKGVDADVPFNLGLLLQRKDRLDEAIDAFREAIQIKEDYPNPHIALGDALTSKGQFTEALVHYRRGHEIGSKNPNWRYPSAQSVRNCERLVAVDAKLPAILSGQKEPADNAERLGVAELCQMRCKKYYAAARHFYSDAFAADPKLADDLGKQPRYHAACAAALAAGGQGADADKLGEKERPVLRRQALDWLRADLKAYQQVMEKDAAKAGREIAQRLQTWLDDSAFAGVRGDDSLGKLSDVEREDWQKLWQEVEALRQRAAPKKEGGKDAPPAREKKSPAPQP